MSDFCLLALSFRESGIVLLSPRGTPQPVGQGLCQQQPGGLGSHDVPAALNPGFGSAGPTAEQPAASRQEPGAFQACFAFPRYFSAEVPKAPFR